MACVNGAIKFVTLDGLHNHKEHDRPDGAGHFVLRTWTLLPDLKEWEAGAALRVGDLWASKSFRDSGIPRLTPTTPILSMDEDDVVCVVMNDYDRVREVDDYGRVRWRGVHKASYMLRVDMGRNKVLSYTRSTSKPPFWLQLIASEFSAYLQGSNSHQADDVRALLARSSPRFRDGAEDPRRNAGLLIGAGGGARRRAGASPDASYRGREEAVVPADRGTFSEDGSAPGAGREAVVAAARGAGTETGSGTASAPRGDGGEAVAAFTYRAGSTAPTPGSETIPAHRAGAEADDTSAFATDPTRAASGFQTDPTCSSSAKTVIASTRHAGYTRAASGSETVPVGAKAVVTSTRLAVSPTFPAAAGAETVPGSCPETAVPGTGITTACSAAASELDAHAVVGAGPALAQLLRALLPRRGARGEGRSPVGVHRGPHHPRQAAPDGLPRLLRRVLIQGNGTERTDPANLSLGGFEVIDAVKRLLEVVCPATVSCSDILVLASREAVIFTGGPAVPVDLGRRDGLVSLASNVRANIIDTGFSVDAMAASFAKKGLSLNDLVTLSGGHTIGLAHCNTFGERFRVANGSMSPVDGSMNTDYANELIRACSVNGTVSVGTAVACDDGSASVFDNRYYGNLLDGRGLLRTDAVLVQNATTRAAVAAFAQSQDAFFASWAESFARLTSLGVKTGSDGEIRRTCSAVNG
ncbi:hypothetical protein PR202_ga19796 [Eleusine coracana subsp. coracana]|uniref:Plant heme peroxidase family profile domain-containing protein n=1 Tax=Eleusine coracana subsp. coracana TaxID=191504 RepID=A0AAV5CUZ3_ELECO|nr:hypothetical protein PR202_ga19796 [Eleusine coracana subsp. coracana]